MQAGRGHGRAAPVERRTAVKTWELWRTQWRAAYKAPPAALLGHRTRPLALAYNACMMVLTYGWGRSAPWHGRVHARRGRAAAGALGHRGCPARRVWAYALYHRVVPLAGQQVRTTLLLSRHVCANMPGGSLLGPRRCSRGAGGCACRGHGCAVVSVRLTRRVHLPQSTQRGRPPSAPDLDHPPSCRCVLYA